MSQPPDISWAQRDAIVFALDQMRLGVVPADIRSSDLLKRQAALAVAEKVLPCINDDELELVGEGRRIAAVEKMMLRTGLAPLHASSILRFVELATVPER